MWVEAEKNDEKTTSSLLPLSGEIANLHGKCKNRKTKNMASFQNHNRSGPCSWKCKFQPWEADLLFHPHPMFFSKVENDHSFFQIKGENTYQKS